MKRARPLLVCTALLGLSACGASDAVGPARSVAPESVRALSVPADTLTTSATGTAPASEPPPPEPEEGGENGGHQGSGN